jgi:hypothetical protein
LEFADICYLLPEMTDKMRHFLGNAFRTMRERAGKHGHYTYQDLLDAVEEQRYGDDEGNRSGNISTIDGLTWRLEGRFRGYSMHQSCSSPASARCCNSSTLSRTNSR